MGSIFGKSKSPKKAIQITEQDKAVLQLKQQRDNIKKLQKRINTQLENDKELARELLRQDKKEKALLILKKKKRLESTLAKAEAQLENVEQMVSTIEFAQIEVEVVKSLQTGNESLKQLQDLMSIDQIEAILEETREGVEKQREIDELLSGTFAQEDEADLLSELESMVEEVARVNLPEVPSDQIGQEETMEEEDEAVTAKKSKSSRQAVLAS